MAADKKAVGLSRVHIYESKCILPLRDNCLFILLLTILALLECTQSADNLFHSFPVLWEKTECGGQPSCQSGQGPIENQVKRDITKE